MTAASSLARLMESAAGSDPAAFEALFKAAVREEMEAVFAMLGKDCGYWAREYARDYAAAMERDREALAAGPLTNHDCGTGSAAS